MFEKYVLRYSNNLTSALSTSLAKTSKCSKYQFYFYVHHGKVTLGENNIELVSLTNYNCG